MNPTDNAPRPANADWLEPAELLLLRACLAEDDCVTPWREWQQLVALDDIDLASLRLIPLLLERLRRAGVADSDLGRYQGIQRKYWYENQMLFQRAAQVVRLFTAAGISTLMLKGVPLAHLYYDRPGLRPMSDFDILVPGHQAAAAMAVLQANGWSGEAQNPNLRNPVPHPFPGEHSWAFKDAAGGEVDLHWRALKTSYAPDADATLWQAAEPFGFAGVESLTLNPADQLLHVCVHGLPANELPSIRWMADAMMILRKRTIDWERLLAQSRGQRVTVMMHAALAGLRAAFAAPVPSVVLDRLAAVVPAPWEQAELAVLVRPGSAARRRQRLCHDFHRFHRTMPGMGARSRLTAYPAYLKIRWDLGHVWEIPFEVLRRIRQFLRQRRARTGSPRGPIPS